MPITVKTAEEIEKMRVAGRLAAVRAAPPLTAGIILGYCPGLIWNAGNHWDSFRYLVPGAPPGSMRPLVRSENTSRVWSGPTH